MIQKIIYNVLHKMRSNYTLNDIIKQIISHLSHRFFQIQFVGLIKAIKKIIH